MKKALQMDESVRLSLVLLRIYFLHFLGKLRSADVNANYSHSMVPVGFGVRS